ncbi:probable disease resistance protein RF9 [Solanum dulcamara]|uniref:probable disease resistance protein RF9 n=1 Tax=Solanum dulcamara TaxID=45834 RepID=UPI0024853B67|nr:probable disease resistance protein RF9 [Solanum dulcamara]
MEILAATKKLKHLALAEETELIGSGAYDEIINTVESMMNLQITDTERVKEIEELVYSIEHVIQTYGVSKRHRAASQKQAKSEITTLCTKIKQFASPHHVVHMHYNINQQLITQNNNFVYKHEDGVPVGLDEEKDLIIQVLLADGSKVLDFLAISIWGHSGTGKMILANEIYKDTRIVDEFRHHRVKIRVSDNINPHDALLHVLKSFEDHVDDRYAAMPTINLEKCVSQHLQESRTLIVLEDVRSIDDWRMLPSVLRAKDCRILFTTRAREVAESITHTVYIHQKRPLNVVNSWTLLKNIVWPEMDPGAEIEPAKERMGTQMVKLCEGIPGAIVALAKQLKGKNPSEWETVQKNARRYLSQVMAPSYGELLDDQKLYFLYLGHFREDPQIEPEKLSHLWELEGLISSQSYGSEMTTFDITQERLMVLDQKRMIDVRQIIEVIKSCSLVGLMGDMCLSKAEETGFLKVLDLQMSTGDHNQPSFSYSKTRRLVIYLGKYDARVTPELAPNLWSLRIIRVHNHQQLEEFVWPSIIMSNIKKFKGLRILDFGRVDFPKGKLPGGIFDLPFLRYLSFEGCFLTELPSSISNLSYLQVLDLRIKDTCNIILPDVLQKMGRLQHLYLPRAFQSQNKKKLRLDGLAKLQTLKNFNSKLCEIHDLFKLKKLQNIDAKVEGSLEDLKSITDLMKNTDHDQMWLRSSIEVKNFDCYTETKHIVFRELLKSGVPPILSFQGHIGQLPPHDDISQSFTEIVLHSTQLVIDPMTTLEKLVKLRLLVLDDDAFQGEKMVCSAAGFPELKHLQLSRLFNFKEWKVEMLAMPRLSHLKIEHCNKLETLPDNSEFLDSLHEFKMIKMPKPFTQKVSQRYENVKSTPSLIILD